MNELMNEDPLIYHCIRCFTQMFRDEEDETMNTCPRCKSVFWTRTLSDEEVRNHYLKSQHGNDQKDKE